MKIEQIVNSVFNSNTWILKHELSKQSWLIDCGDFAQINDSLTGKYDMKGIFLTHSHFDHIYGLNEVLSKWPFCRIYTNDYGVKSLLSDKLNFSKYHNSSFIISSVKNVILIEDGFSIELFDNIMMNCYYTPGHDPSCFCYRCGDAFFSGDSFIPNVKPVTNLRGGNKNEYERSVSIIDNVLKECNVLYPGHGPFYLLTSNVK